MVLETDPSLYAEVRAELEEHPEVYRTAADTADARFHGTIMEAGHEILEEGVLEPEQETAAGENPQDVVCATRSFTTALVYAEEGTPEIDEELNQYVNEAVAYSHAIDTDDTFDIRNGADRARLAELVGALEEPYGGVDGHLKQLGERIHELPGIDRTPVVIEFDDVDGIEESYDDMIVATGDDTYEPTNNEVQNHRNGDVIAEDRYDRVDLSDATFYVPHEEMDGLADVYPDREIRSLEAKELAHREAMEEVYAEEGRLEYSPVYTGDRPFMFDTELVPWDGETISRYTGA